MTTSELPAREVLQSLMAVKGWFRDTNRLAFPQHSTTALFALALLEQHGPARVSELAEHSRLDVSVVSRQLAHLEQAGLASRAADPQDGRAHLLSLTPAGAAVLEDGRSRLESVVTERLAGWDAADLSAFAATLRQLLTDLGRQPAS